MVDQPSFTCPVCGMTSYNPNDIREGFCGNCHAWTMRELWGGSTLNPYKWVVRKDYRYNRLKPWTVTDPMHMCDDNDQAWFFADYHEAIRFAQREAFRDKLKEDFAEYLEGNQNRGSSPEFAHTGLDTMCRTFAWWGRYDLAGFLENI